VRVKDLPVSRAAELLSGEGLRVRFGPCNIRISSNYSPLLSDFYLLYASYEIAADEIADVHLQIRKARDLRRPFARLVSVLIDGHPELPVAHCDQAIAALQQSINWVLVTRIFDLLNLRAAVVEKNGCALLLPAIGQQSEAAQIGIMLAYRGYRLVSGELALLESASGKFCPLPGPVPVGHEVLAELGAVVQPSVSLLLPYGGAAAYVAAPAESVDRAQESVAASWIIVPQRKQGARSVLTPLNRSEAFTLLASQSFNYELLGASAFNALTQLVQRCECYKLVYSDLQSALALLSELTHEH